MASAFEWTKTWLENLIKPFMENKKAVLMLMGLFIGTGAYTVYDMTGNKLETISAPEILKVKETQEYPSVEPRVVKPHSHSEYVHSHEHEHPKHGHAEFEILIKKAMKDHIKEFH